MSHSRTKKHAGASVPLSMGLTTETRIDEPHPLAANDAVPVAPVEPEAKAALVEKPVEKPVDKPVALSEGEFRRTETVPLPDEAMARILRTQASQLAEHLRARQKELDHREAEINSRAAQLERDARAARLWLDERTAELEEHDEAACPKIEPPDDSLCRKTEALDARQRDLDEAEAQLETERAEIQQIHQKCDEDRRRLDDDARTQRERLAAAERRLSAETEERRRAVAQRSEQVDQSRVALEQLRKELSRMHRETLEIRLATEELWAQLSDAAPPAALTRSLGRIRSKLADHYRLSNAELQRQKQDFEKLRDELVRQHQNLLDQKRQFDQWTAGCREEVEQQAARLQVRGDEIDRREAELREQSRQWEAERLELRQELRRLRSRRAPRGDALPV